jgi:HEAT repeat protein
MRALVAVAVALAVAGAGPARSVEPPSSITHARIEVRPGVTPAAALDQAARDKGTLWVGWSVEVIPKEGDVCCLSDSFKRRGCTLGDRGENSWGSSDAFAATASKEVYVLVETKGGAPTRVKLMSPTCPVDGADRRLVWLGPADAGTSLTALGALLDAEPNTHEIGDAALVAIAYHRDGRADALIEKRVLDRSLPVDERQKATFWAGQTRGETGFRLLERVLASDPSGALREHAVFAMSQSPLPQAPERIKRVAVEDQDPEMRSHAYFSLSQTHTPDAGKWIVGRLDAERDEQVRQQAIFALSQLQDGTDWLLEVMRVRHDPETVRQALFWLAQSEDPRALEEIEKILGR